MPAGYSKTPLSKKLGIKPKFRLWVIGAPQDYELFFRNLPVGITFTDNPEKPVDFIHIFANTRNAMNDALARAKPHLKMNGTLWISWPKKSSDISSEIGKFDVMKAGQAIGLVDVKVAAIDEDWSGHKFVYRAADRSVESEIGLR